MQPEQLGPFRIGRVLGRGGMGAVYEGVHEQTGETAAVKVLLSTLQEDDELRLRFEAEIDTLKRLRHPNIVRLFGFGEEQGMLYYVMEMVDGPSLHQEMKRQRLFQWHEVAKIGLEMCFAFKHAHDRGITHRDIKPANILLERQGTIKLSDFGIAHFFGGQRLTEIHSVVGTLEYMSPEQALASPVNTRSDLYSLGAVLYALLVGRPPFTARNLPEILRKHQKGIIESIRATRLDVPDELEIIIFDLLKIKPEDRPHNAYLVAKRFQSLLQALVGPPERIFVKPMELDSPMAFPMESVRIPYKGDQEQDKKIGQARGVIIDNGIIDLGGFINNEQTNPVNPSQKPFAEDASFAATSSFENIKPDEILPSETALPNSGTTSLADSFGQPGSVAKEDKTLTLELSTPLSALPEQSVTQSFTLSGSSEHPPDVSDSVSAESFHTGFQQPEIPSPEEEKTVSDFQTGSDEIDVAKSSRQYLSDVLAETNKTQEDQNKPDKKFVETNFSEKFPYHSPIQHGEVILENVYGIRPAKDEPLPDVSVFDALQKNRHTDMEAEDMPTIEVDLSGFGHSKETNNLTHNKPTVDGLTTGHLPGFHVPSTPTPSNHISSSRSEVSGNMSGKPSEQKNTFEPYGLQNAGITVAGSRDRSSATTEHSASVSHFTAVKDEEFDTFDNPSAKHRPVISLQVVFASCCLILIGITVYYLLQPVSADTLYERIKRTINENSDSDGISSSALRSAEGDINHFLLEYSQHPMADQVRFYQAELDLVRQEQILKRRQRLANSETPSPVEQVYMEATALIKTDPESAIVKLKAIVDVFRSDHSGNFNHSDSDKPSEKPETLPSQKSSAEPAKITRRQRPNPTELCVELATRRLEKLEKEIDTISADQFKVIRKRLDDAKELEQKSPERAKDIRLGIIELYQHYHWAKPLVDEAQQELKK
ncbi:MAG: serine/threonine protein kinase [Planctomycetaceae bacterium]|jgi:serine/threonine protein kinase|nr:serine/threonine protein kinase [Planctomycetaceae bacterium]